ncbi:aspartyl-tRNA(Asn)/glutamyl-tRNA(Gln) amidotransferase subunit B [Peptoniphilus koenoeneniae]|uniref:Aspartyl/glutamyl-tRNA(Asn/Gln) amidotransferase subunit B n=1 Tax=Peptoniphilus koenoeneniae TaxID=507751 RepID=A0ABU0AWM6_9FIRM|nr:MULTISPECIES: Asp-tRNA(Asn)/Glu-tRNA(Gln) amidotransferase subunit GatB [Peptoniphilus]ERT60172.1 aspartyl/glutamyl-tRNA(Asn/Gln) amidotransferase, B subunit [Peptoniphilus sp. BV3C26]MDQ0274400.1 aspartyl-tRNA(Asn)/glutamyl-tRNA(Gln) amidotransferase subunit B [Peptoniphilus koenoeneniae]
MKYKTIVGLEIHVELSTKTKAFCSCENAYGKEPNTLTCPVCLGLPGGLPVLNENVVKYSVMAGLALNCEIKNHSKFDRKNYFYPDLTKGFQITQDDQAICYDGYIEIEGQEGPKKVGIYKIQMEEDTGKSLHMEEDTLMDYNRCGVPLIEIVSKPDMNSGAEARMFLENLKSTLVYLGISDCKMEEGSLRCDVNVNVIDTESGKKTKVTEVKNLNSFRGVEKAIDFEVERHIGLLEKGEEELRTTRRWDDANNKTVLMRIKYTVADYRFAPEGDLPPVEISDEYIEEIRRSMPELPKEKSLRFVKEYKLPKYDAEVLTSTIELADYYEKLVEKFDDYNMASNWMMTEVLRRVDLQGDEKFKTPFEVEDLKILLEQIKENKINNNAGKKVLREMFETGKKPLDIIKEKGLIQISDTGEIEKIVDKIISENPQSIEDYKNGKDRALGFLVGQVMKASRGKANPQLANKMILEKLKNI